MLDMYSGASLLRTLYMNKPMLYSSCFCKLINEGGGGGRYKT